MSPTSGRRIALTGLMTATAVLGGISAHASAQVLAVEWHGTDGSGFGGSVANAGDVDADGVDDLLVGELDYSTAAGDVGRMWVYSGRTFDVIRSHDGIQDDEGFGSYGAAMGDVDGDGYGEYAIAAIDYDTAVHVQAGRITAWSGKTGTMLWEIAGSSDWEFLGIGLGPISDRNGDGRFQLLTSQSSGDMAHLLDSYGNLLLTLHGDDDSQFGFPAARCGDVDGDGCDDFLVAAHAWDNGTESDVGEVRVYSGMSASLLFRFEGDDAEDRLGSSLAGIGDVDGDGVPDFLVGASEWGVDQGYARVVSGSSGATVRTHYGWVGGEELGAEVCSIADLDNDGVDDYGVFTWEQVYGMIRVYSGRDGSVVWEYMGNGFYWFLGRSTATGDFNSDSIEDLAIADYAFEDRNGAEIGSVMVQLAAPARWSNYGVGWPGKNGIPGLIALDDPGVGEPISLQLDNSLGASTVALLFVGFAETSAPTSAGGTLLVLPEWIQTLALPAGGIVLSDKLPDDPALYLFDVFVQALEADPFASNKISFTPGLVLRCGFDL